MSNIVQHVGMDASGECNETGIEVLTLIPMTLRPWHTCDWERTTISERGGTPWSHLSGGLGRGALGLGKWGWATGSCRLIHVRQSAMYAKADERVGGHEVRHMTRPDTSLSIMQGLRSALK